MKNKLLELNGVSGLYTDFYQLTMAQGYYLTGKHKQQASFDYVFRKNPFGGGYTIFAGISDVLQFVSEMRFNNDAIEHLRSYNFNEEFLKYLKDFRFKGNIYSAKEGEIVFPNQPVCRVEGNLIETQIVETGLLNLLNYQSLIATKASRLRKAAGDRIILDFGMRRAQTLASIHGSKAAIIGGLDGTSNVYSSFLFEIKASGTQAHPWIQSFPDELTAFREFAKIFPNNCVLLVDTYNTLKMGIPNAIITAKEMESRGDKLLGIRLDSGDLSYLSKKARTMLDEAGLKYVKIVASNQLDEHIIKSLLEQGSPIDVFGVGTSLITGQNDGALDGVYKLSMLDGKPRMKFSENIEKMILPGVKNILRFFDSQNYFFGDSIIIDEEDEINTFYHPIFPYKFQQVKGLRFERLIEKVLANGEIILPYQNPNKIANYTKERLRSLPEEHIRFEYPHVYKIGISKNLSNLKDNLIKEIIAKYNEE